MNLNVQSTAAYWLMKCVQGLVAGAVVLSQITEPPVGTFETIKATALVCVGIGNAILSPGMVGVSKKEAP